MNDDVAIFTRNFTEHLDGAVEISQNDPEQLITFRSLKAWRKAQEFLRIDINTLVYFSSVGSRNLVDYSASLKTIKINPKDGDNYTDFLLSLCTESTKNEGLWDGKVKTLYVIANCKKLKKPFPITSLIKLSDGKHISKDYGYGYSIVKAIKQDFLTDFEKYPEEISKEDKFYEGAVKKALVNRYERDPRLRKKCIEIFGDSCSTCGMTFKDEYGDMGDGYIIVHHLIPLSEIKEHHETNPETDLRPVCPNCHTMLHKKSPPYTIEELKRIVEQVKK